MEHLFELQIGSRVLVIDVLQASCVFARVCVEWFWGGEGRGVLVETSWRLEVGE